ncbi:MAG: hypothetical protein CM15mP102_21210 [Flavobacteriales bacterium]|nr:MAG: hypothetical protein CM15mP102_21210 [Flavobacteriales bacterium]
MIMVLVRLILDHQLSFSNYGNTSSSTSTVTQYSLTVSAGVGGSVSTSGGTYDDGTIVTITAFTK